METPVFLSLTLNIVSFLALPPNFDISKCNSTTFMCKSRLQCIAESNVCDDSLQCHDGSDEYDCDYYSWTNGNILIFWCVYVLGVRRELGGLI